MSIKSVNLTSIFYPVTSQFAFKISKLLGEAYSIRPSHFPDLTIHVLNLPPEMSRVCWWFIKFLCCGCLKSPESGNTIPNRFDWIGQRIGYICYHLFGVKIRWKVTVNSLTQNTSPPARQDLYEFALWSTLLVVLSVFRLSPFSSIPPFVSIFCDFEEREGDWIGSSRHYTTAWMSISTISVCSNCVIKLILLDRQETAIWNKHTKKKGLGYYYNSIRLQS